MSYFRFRKQSSGGALAEPNWWQSENNFTQRRRKKILHRVTPLTKIRLLFYFKIIALRITFKVERHIFFFRSPPRKYCFLEEVSVLQSHACVLSWWAIYETTTRRIPNIKIVVRFFHHHHAPFLFLFKKTLFTSWKHHHHHQRHFSLQAISQPLVVTCYTFWSALPLYSSLKKCLCNQIFRSETVMRR